MLEDIELKEEIGNMHVDSDLQFLESNIDVISNGERTIGKLGLYKKYFSDDVAPLSASYTEYENAFNA